MDVYGLLPTQDRRLDWTIYCPGIDFGEKNFISGEIHYKEKFCPCI